MLDGNLRTQSAGVKTGVRGFSKVPLDLVFVCTLYIINLLLPHRI